MRRLSKKIKIMLVGLCLLSLALLAGCGSSSRNDQGSSFTFFGWFDDTTGTMGLSSVSVPIASSAPEPVGFETALVGFAGLQNNLVGQFIRVERIFHSYSAPGANVRIPDTSVSVPGVLGQGIGVSDSTLPPAAATIDNEGFFGALLIPPSVREFIALNRSDFPEPPFVIVVSSYASGVTSAGNRLDSNLVEIDVLVTPEIFIEPTVGEEDPAAAPLDTDQEDIDPDQVDEQFN